MMLNRRHLLASAGALAAGPVGSTMARSAGWDAGLHEVLAASGAPSLGGMVVGPSGVIWSGAAGSRQSGSSAAVTVEDRWHLGSNTKAMTAALYGRLVDQGRVRWGDTLSMLMPELSMDAAWRDVPITSVMGHVAGLRDQTAMGTTWLMTARSDLADLPTQRRALVQASLAVPPTGTPGVFGYANINYVLLGAVIETVTGQSWEEVMRAELFASLGIASGGFGAPIGAEPWGHRAGQAIDPSSPLSDNPLALGPAGTAHMTLSDYARFLQIFLTEDTDWVSADSRATLMRAVGAGQPAYGGGWIVADGQPWAAGPALTHDGSNTMWYASAWVAPGAKRAFVTVSNDGQAGRDACRAMIPRLIQAT